MGMAPYLLSFVEKAAAGRDFVRQAQQVAGAPLDAQCWQAVAQNRLERGFNRYER
jgi:hypothetical protein